MEIEKLYDKAFEKMRLKYPGMTTDDLQKELDIFNKKELKEKEDKKGV